MGIPVQMIRLGAAVVVVGGVMAFKIIAANSAEKKIDKAIANMGISKDQISYDVSVDLLGLATHIEDIEMKLPNKENFKIDEIVINDIDAKHQIPEYLDLEINGIHGNTKSLKMFDRNMARILDSMNKDELITNIGVDYTFDKDAKVLNLKNLSFNVEDMGSFSLATKIHDVNSIANAAMGFNYAKLGSSSVEYEDDGLADTLFAYNAKRSGQDLDKFKENIVKDINKEIEKADKQQKDYKVKMLSAIADFVEDPNSIEFSMEPEKPIAFYRLSRGLKREDTLKTLHFDISVD